MIDDAVIPHNLDAERAVLGALLINNGLYDLIAGTLKPAHFFRDAHRVIYAAIAAILDAPVSEARADLVLVNDYLKSAGTLEDAGGPAYLAKLCDAVPTSINIVHYAQVVRDKAARRDTIQVFNELVTDAYSDQPLADVLMAADQAIVSLQGHGGAGRLLSLQASGRAFLSDLERRHSAPGGMTGIPTGFSELDKMGQGWQAGDVTIIAARPSIGKTTLVMNCAAVAAMQAKRGAIFSLEMRRVQLEYRLLASLSGVPLAGLLSGEIMATDWPKVSQAAGVMQTLPLFINDAGGMTIGDIRADCKRLKADGGLDFVVIDYVQLIAGSGNRKGASRNDEMTDISRRTKALADELAVPVLLLSQMSRAGEKRADPWPQLSDLRESGSLEQDADNVAFLHRKNHRDGGLTWLIMAKQRNGPTGTIKLSLDRAIVTFTEYDGPDQAEEPATDAKKVKPPKVARIG